MRWQACSGKLKTCDQSFDASWRNDVRMPASAPKSAPIKRAADFRLMTSAFFDPDTGASLFSKSFCY